MLLRASPCLLVLPTHGSQQNFARHAPPPVGPAIGSTVGQARTARAPACSMRTVTTASARTLWRGSPPSRGLELFCRQ
jgi:hypothetical protein